MKMLSRFPALVLAVLLILAGMLVAQDHQPAHATQPAHSESQPADPNRVTGQALAHESEQAVSGEAHSEGQAHGEGGGHGGHDQFKYSPVVRKLAQLLNIDFKVAYWIFLGINFAIIFGAIYWISRSRIPAAFRSRTAAIQKGIEEARRASEDANRRLSDVESRLQRLDSEIAAMKAQAESDAQAEEERIRLATEQEARKVVDLAEQEIAAAGNAARRELKAYAAELAVNIAEKKVRLSPETDEALVRSFVEGLGKDGR